MAIWTLGGRQVAAQLLLGETFFLGVGEGDPAWDTVPVDASPGDIDLVDRVGVTRLRDIQFATEDPGGSITMADGSKWSFTAQPTRYVFLDFKLDLADGEGHTLRETGLFHGTELAPAVPAGQMYVPNADIVDYGRLMQVDRFNSVIRDGSLEQRFTYIITL
ncbi:hypothetical protein JF546_09850 [Nitratireductor aquimarinus]|uniref:hypothetical protein n=1 Tax=Nitratireductor aquimarinus TaxID=889300 RepID=UPI001A8DC1F6|nr:hypothetical protein [Nitratireductor aquimarinus]MBN8243313.1 hypothetical protein [Nitratireductor aquimarinus]MBY6131214.1 hypothetical protein [Nitratireductor aquimarinus]MCA1302030.1 hypothetical protein [Nitratireductor aquimarinus]